MHSYLQDFRGKIYPFSKESGGNEKEGCWIRNKVGMVQCFGCVDGTNAPIIRPKKNSQDYYCYKGFFSINVQEICDYRGYLIDFDCSWPGSVHDAKVFSNSAINNVLRTEEGVSTYVNLITGQQKIPSYLVADPAYPLLPYCIKEFDRCDSNEKVVFNNMLRGAWNPIECAFGRLKAGWGVLTKPIDLNLTSIPNVIYACFILHYICKEHNLFIDDSLVEMQENFRIVSERNHPPAPDTIFSFNSYEGEIVRDTLTYIFISKNEQWYCSNWYWM